MTRFFYDLHTHSCLSPCADNDSTPTDLVGMAKLNGLDILALTDHNTCENCPAFFEAASEAGIVAVAGMELTTSEDIHMVCLFERLDDAMRFSKEIYGRRILIPNRPDIFGDQLIMDVGENIIGCDEHLLSNATTVSVEEAVELVKSFGGVCYPAHIDREANGIVAVLGTVPLEYGFGCVELHSRSKLEEYTERFGLEKLQKLVCSDAHYLWDVSERENFVELDADISNPDSVRRALLNLLR